MKQERLARQHVVLIGIGHTNAHIVRKWGMNPIPDTDLTCISDRPIAAYSGMLPAVLAGQVPRSAMEIDLVRLCNSVGARLIIAKPQGLDHERQEVQFSDRPSIPYDVLSIGIGSIPAASSVEVVGDSLIEIKPMQTFLDRLQQRLNAVTESRAQSEPLQVTVVGSGVAGVEILFCLQRYLDQQGHGDARLRMVTRSSQVLDDLRSSTRRRVLNAFAARGVEVITDQAVIRVTPQDIELADGRRLQAELVLWSTGAAAPPSLAEFGLPVDERGFLATDPTLQTKSGKPIFAVGDTGTLASNPTPKAGVYAVRQGPILWDNIQRYLAGKPLVPYRPQRSFLRLINLGDGQAIGDWRGLSFQGRYAYRLKDYIDSSFMEKHEPLRMDAESDAMQCKGCGCKLGTKSLGAAVAALDIEQEDAAEIGKSSESQMLASTDFFSSPFDDAYLSGRVAAIHSASDLVATGAAVTEALANVVLPEGDPRTQERTLHDFLAGAKREFAAMGTKIVGGHTIVGPRMEVGFTVVGHRIGKQRLLKSGLRDGDGLFLTKPLGIGVLLAAHMRSECFAADYQQLISALLDNQHAIAGHCVELGLQAATDITGFGLAGHLSEMLDASQLGAVIHLRDIPLLPGVLAASESGIGSSLLPDNLHFDRRLEASSEVKQSAAYPILFDPQTCGGLLIGVPQEKEEAFIATFPGRDDIRMAARIGTVRKPFENDKRLLVKL